ncbi:MAG: hypothetical protein ACK5BN_12415 [Planctomycetota bacterium]
MDTRQAALIARYSFRYSIRGGIGLVFLLVSLTFGLLVAHLTLQPLEQAVRIARAESKKQATRDETEVARGLLRRIEPDIRPIVTWALQPATPPGADPADEAVDDAKRWADHLIKDKPMLLSAILLILMIGWPMCASLGAVDLYAGDIASRQLRYQLLRADRASIYFGRLLGAMLTYATVLVLLGGTIALYIGFKLPVYPLSDVFAWAAYGVGALLVETLPYLALCAWLSASFSSSFVSLTIVTLIIGGVPLAALLARSAWFPARHLDMLLPWGYQLRLFHPDLSQVALAAGGCLLHAALFTWLGHRKFTTRDL